MGVHVGGTRPFNPILTVSTFDIAVSHLSLTRAERESREEGRATMGDGRKRAGGNEGFWR